MRDERLWARAGALTEEMTVEEMASQLRYDAPAIPRLGIPAYNWWNEALHGVARAGTATVFPQAIGLASTFDEALMERVAQAISIEGRAKYNAGRAEGDRGIYKGLTFWSPNVNLFRDPRWGRGHETYGEDPVLTARLGVRFVRGIQGNGRYYRAAACAKHFAVHSGPEEGRHEFDSRVNEKDLCESYLYAFEKLVREAGVEAVMGAYNRLNGEPCCGSRRLLQDILRGQWGFEGHVVSDCGAIADFHLHHHVTDTAPESAALALKNGCDINCGQTYLHILAAYQEGLVTKEEIALSARRAMYARLRLGLFDEACEWNAVSPLENDTDEHAALAREAASRAMVLLKNEGLLPLDLNRLKTVAVIGPNADSVRALEGNYSGTSSRAVTFLAGIRAACTDKARVLYAQGCHLYRDRMEGTAQPDDRLSEAVAAAKMSDVAILCLGLDSSIEGEAGDTSNQYGSGDKVDLELPESQRRLLKAIGETGTPLVIVLASGSALRVEEANAILQAWYPGQAGGLALADMIFGRVSPSGRLPVTFYYGVQDLPDFSDYGMNGRTYRYFAKTPLYPFGYGLSYVRFDYADAAYASRALSVTVSNRGDMDAEEVVQAYVKAESPYAPPNARLCAFARVRVAAGESVRVTLPLEKDAFTVVNDAGERVAGGPGFTFYLGGAQPDERSAQLTGRRSLALTVRV